jgi:hypothetical protein
MGNDGEPPNVMKIEMGHKSPIYVYYRKGANAPART